MNNLPVMYTPEQMEEIEAFIAQNFGKDKENPIMHEIVSEYVHTDIAVIAPEGESKTFVSFGMGAREMNSPIDFNRTELVMSASEGFNTSPEIIKIVGSEICRLSKIPFANDTWLGPGHTVDASELFKNTFGFDAFLFMLTGICAEITDVGDVVFLVIIPIYEDERSWIMENGSFEYLPMLYEKFGCKLLNVDTRRSHYIPAPDDEC